MCLVLAGTVLSSADHLDATVTEPGSDGNDRAGVDEEAWRRFSARPVVLTRRDKLTRLDEVLATLPPEIDSAHAHAAEERITWQVSEYTAFNSGSPETDAAHAAEELITWQVTRYAALNGGSPVILSLDCRGETLCKLVLDHLTQDAVRANIEAMKHPDELFTWNGPIMSGSAGGPMRQLLFLLDELLVFDGWDIVERKEGPSREARSARSR